MGALLTPAAGVVIWTTIAFLTVLFILRKFAWKPILKGLKDREESIDNALSAAERARNEMANLQADNERLLQDARVERDRILKEARDMRDSMVNDAKGKAQEEADRMITAAREAIANEKNRAVAELKNQVANLSIEIAEKLVRQNLSGDAANQELAEKLADDVKLN
ncbi:MAG: F0F1 ATP synthase subunit B [Flavobacteriales bacterium]